MLAAPLMLHSICKITVFRHCDKKNHKGKNRIKVIFNNNKKNSLQCLNNLKALTDHFEGESRLYSFDPYWQTGGLEIFLSYFKGPSSQDQQKTLRRRLITFKVTLTGQSHFLLIFVLRKVTLRSHINSVP
jgi:hypothetical protein